MLIDAGMPTCFWSCAVEHACFVVNRLYCLRTKKVLIIDFLDCLKQPHNEKINLNYLPRFSCRAHKLIQPQTGKFEAVGEKGWFFGFQRNTSKNYLVYHPRWSSQQKWKCIESFTPHVTFNEDEVFGDQLDSLD